MMKRDLSLNAVVSAHHKVAVITKVEISETSSVAEILKISSLTYLAADVAVHVRDKIFRPNPQLHFAKLALAQR